MYSHLTLGTNNVEAAKTFYDATITAIGGRAGRMDPQGRAVYIHNGSVLILTLPIDGQPASTANGMTVGFKVETTEQADAWHEAGLAHGGTAIEDPPGWREKHGLRLYLAYLRDPDGNKLCTMFQG